MKKYIIFLIIGIFLLSSLSTVTSLKNNDIVNNEIQTLIDSYAPFQIINTEIKSIQKNIDFPKRPLQNKAEGYDYIIITTDDLLETITTSDFVVWKESIGFNINILTITDTLIQDQPGNDLPAKIRNFLRSYYETWGINYVLIIGSHESIPMRYCYPDPYNHQFNIYDWSRGGEVPTDYYYADLSKPDEESWDADQDGFYGEFTQDQPDFNAEVYVGRIPTSDVDRVVYTLQKITSFEQNTESWKNNALHAGSMLFYKYEDHQYNIDHDIDGATCLAAIEEDLMQQDWTISHLSEQEGISPSIYPWDALTEPSFTKEWRTGTYSVVNWAGHGSAIGVGRTIWDHDNNGNGIPEHANNEIIGEAQINIWSQLEDDYPSIVFAVSCLVGYPEPTGYGNLGIDLLTDESLGAAVAICSASRPAAITVNFTKYHAGAEALCYEFNHYMINGPDGSSPVGQALYESKAFVHYNYGWDWYYEYKNLYNYNLYGDPSMMREGVSDEEPSISIQSPSKGIYINGNKILPFISSVIIGDIIIQTQTSNTIQQVEFYLNNELLNIDYNAPFEQNITELNTGKHTIKVIAYDTINRQDYDEMKIWKLL